MNIRNMIFTISLIGAAFSSPIIAHNDTASKHVQLVIDTTTINSIYAILPTTVAINGAISGGIHEFSKGYKKALKGVGAGLIVGGMVGKLAAIALASNITYKYNQK